MTETLNTFRQGFDLKIRVILCKDSRIKIHKELFLFYYKDLILPSHVKHNIIQMSCTGHLTGLLILLRRFYTTFRYIFGNNKKFRRNASSFTNKFLSVYIILRKNLPQFKNYYYIPENLNFLHNAVWCGL